MPAANTEAALILIVDDDRVACQAHSELIAKLGLRITTATSGPEALDKVTMERPAVMVLDILMPEMNGIDVIPEALDRDPDLAIIMVTSEPDIVTIVTCIQRGAMDYLVKPVDGQLLQRAVTRAVRRRDALREDRELNHWLKREMRQRSEELEEARIRLEVSSLSVLDALVRALEAKNQYLAGHSARVAAFSATIASALDLSDDEVEQVRTGGRLHDLGMIGIRESVLNKEGSLTDEEYNHVKEHVEIGTRILAPMTHLQPVIDSVHSHHERWDGSGYPDGVAGEDIPLGGRIIHAAEIYDALTTHRPYHDMIDPDAAVKRMREVSGKVLDPKVTDALEAAVRRRQTIEFLHP